MADRAGQHRDIVYCHQCEQEWYRDEHGLTCPYCHGDFTEIVEEGHDPRDDSLLQDDPDDDHRGPRSGAPPMEYYGAPDPDEEDIDDIQWAQTAPGRMTGTFSRTYNFGPGQPPQPPPRQSPHPQQPQQQPQQQQQQQPGDPHGAPPVQGGGLGGVLMGAIGSLLSGALGAQQYPPQQGQAHPGGRPLSPGVDPGSRSQSATGSPQSNVRHYHFPGGSMTIASSSMTFGGGGGGGGGPGGPGGGASGGFAGPRNANGPQPFNPQPEMIDQMMAQMMANIGVFPGAPGGGGGHPGMAPGQQPGQEPGMPGAGLRGPFILTGGPVPFNIFDILIGGPGMGGGRVGDAVFSQDALDRVITQLMEQHQSGNAPGPASEAAIKALPTRDITQADLDEQTGRAECSICMDDVQVGASVTVLPCSHWFHGDCIKAWLSEHDTCPHCRQGIMPKDEHNAQRPREASEAPLHDTHSAAYHGPRAMPDGFPAAVPRDESGGQEHPSTDPHSPQSRPGAARQGSSSGGNLLSRMRDAFSPSSTAGGGGGGGSTGGGGSSSG